MVRVVRIILGMYPPWWRHRYGAETADLTEQLLDEPEVHRWRLVASLLSGSVLAWLQVRRISSYLSPLESPNEWGMIPRGSHRDLFGNRGLWPRSEAEFEPGERLLGVLDGVVGNWKVARGPRVALVYLVVPLIVWLFSPIHPLLGFAAGGAIAVVLGLALRAVTHSLNVAVAVTTHGVVIFRRGITGRTGKLIERMPPVSPELVKFETAMRNVRLGDRTFWFRGPSDPAASDAGPKRRPYSSSYGGSSTKSFGRRVATSIRKRQGIR